MHIESFREYCLSKPGATESFPFDQVTLVFKVAGKMFSLTSLDRQGLWISLKCDPDLAVELRSRYENVVPGYHLNKRHWNSITADDRIGDDLLKEWIDHSYDLVVKSLPAKKREELSRGE